MRMFDKFTRSAKRTSNAITSVAGKAGSAITVTTQKHTELATLRSQINGINQELNAAYAQIGKKYVESVLGEITDIDISDLLELIEPKLTRKQELEQAMIQLEVEMNQKTILREKAAAEEEFEQEKYKLTKALAMHLMTQEEYDVKLSAARKKAENFEAIRKIQQQADMGLITSAERKERIAFLSSIESMSAVQESKYDCTIIL